MSNTGNHAKRELDILLKTVEDPGIRHFVPEIIKLCEAFGNSGQSGGSAPFVAEALSKAVKNLCLQDPICPITGIDEEWNEVTEQWREQTGEKITIYQNNRQSAIFKETGKPAYYLDAIIFKSDVGGSWCGSAILKDETVLLSRQYIKGFPFESKTFYIDVIDKEDKDGSTFYVKDESQLKEVFEYYDRYVD